jgi:hypothetical protein
MQQVSKVIHTFFLRAQRERKSAELKKEALLTGCIQKIFIRRVKKRSFTNGLHTKNFRRT